MFTGLIENVGSVVRLERRSQTARLTVSTDLPLDEIALGDSVAVNGVCLTVVDSSVRQLIFDVSPETIDRTSFSSLTSGSPVNLERALRLSDRLGGHLVSGHVDCLGTIIERHESSGNVVFGFRLPIKNARYIIEKGSVTIDGVSLTVNAVGDDSFTVNIIPHTAASTTLQYCRIGDTVNIETDIIGKYVERLLGSGPLQTGKGLTMESLARNGFI